MVVEKTDRTHSAWSWETAAAALILGIGFARIVALALNPIELYADESQYWVWSLQLDWGYFSKPPMIAWLIHLMTPASSSSAAGSSGMRAPDSGRR